MFRLITNERWRSFEKEGKFRFIINESINGICVVIAVFCIGDFIFNYDSQTVLMKTGLVTSIIGAPCSSIAMWYYLKKKYGASD